MCNNYDILKMIPTSAVVILPDEKPDHTTTTTPPHHHHRIPFVCMNTTSPAISNNKEDVRVPLCSTTTIKDLYRL